MLNRLRQHAEHCCIELPDLDASYLNHYRQLAGAKAPVHGQRPHLGIRPRLLAGGDRRGRLEGAGQRKHRYGYRTLVRAWRPVDVVVIAGAVQNGPGTVELLGEQHAHELMRKVMGDRDRTDRRAPHLIRKTVSAR